MKKKAAVWAVAVSCIMSASLAACAPQTRSEREAPVSNALEEPASTSNSPAEEIGVDETKAAMEERAEKYAPEVRTLSDGTRVQLTPTVEHGYFIYPETPTSYNTYYLDADDRGCMSCHSEGLADLVENKMLLKHIELSNDYGTDVTPMECQLCHDVAQGYTAENFEFGNLIHGIHNDVTNATCMTCHTATSDGNGMRLWEESKYEVLQGINFVEADTVEADFSYEQDTQSEQMFHSSWMSGNNNQAMIDKDMTNEPLDPEVFDTWTIAVTGLVDNPFSMTLPELIETAPTETFMTTQMCGMNPAGGELIANVEVTGIPVSWLLDKAGIKDGATAVMATAPDGWSRGNPLKNLDEREGYLVYEINGERLEWATGYPVRMWYPGRSAQNQIRWTGELEVVDTPLDKLKQFKGWYLTESNTLDFSVDAVQMKYDADAVGEGWNKPNAGILHLHEGQIIEAGQPYEFEGYAYGFDTQIAAVEVSLDNGKTWIRLDTSDSDLTRWVYWHFTYTPEKTGAYVLAVRAVTVDGDEGYLPDKVMFNAE